VSLPVTMTVVDSPAPRENDSGVWVKKSPWRVSVIVVGAPPMFVTANCVVAPPWAAGWSIGFGLESTTTLGGPEIAIVPPVVLTIPEAEALSVHS